MAISAQSERTFERRLRAERDHLVEQAGGAGSGASHGERESDMADGSATTEQERQLAVTSELRAKLEEVDRALEKLQEGTYGTCDSCGAPIPVERLEILPQASLCVACKSKPRRHNGG